MSKFLAAKRRDLEISPLELDCAACDSKFFDTSGARDNLTRLNQLFLDSLSIEVPGSNETILCLKFCPICTLKLLELENLLAELENLQLRVQNVKDFMCATVTNAAFKSRNQPVRNNGDACNGLIMSIREQAIQNWISTGRTDVQLSGSSSKPLNRTKASASSKPDFECQGQNGLEIFDRIEEEEAEQENASGADAYSNSSAVSYVTEVTEAPNPPIHRTQSIKVEPDWGEVVTTSTFTHTHEDDLADETSMQLDTPSAVSVDGSQSGSEAPTTVYFDQVTTTPNGIIFANHQTSASNSPAPAIIQTVYPTVVPTASVQVTTTKAASAPAVKLPPSTTVVEIEMCTLCFKYVVSGVGHTCGEKSTTTNYQCGYCNTVFHSEKALKDHVRRHISDDNNRKINRVYGCKICRKIFPSTSKLTQHIKTEHDTKALKCRFCPKTFKDKSLFNIHIIQHSKAPVKKKGSSNGTPRPAAQATELKKAAFYSFIARPT